MVLVWLWVGFGVVVSGFGVVVGRGVMVRDRVLLR